MPCVEIEELEGYATGVSNGTPRTHVAEHLSSCADCRSRLAEVEANLSVGASVRRAAARGAPAAVAVPETIGPYRIENELGRGGMGVVYRARQQHPSRTVALKLIRPDLVAHEASPTLLRRFEQEANVLARLQHPGIARVYDAGVAEVVTAAGRHDQPFLAMELVAGRRLDAFADERGLDRRGRLDLMARVADAVHHAHLKGVIHRDLKPSNILVEDGSGAAPQPKILDFGVARVVESDRQAASWETDIGKLLGTLPYMSPEQVAGDAASIDARSDVYALGVIAFELLTGALPYDLEQRSLLDAARLIREAEPRRAGAIEPALRGDVDTILAKALAKAPERRYQSAAELGADIRRSLRDEPITARPATALYQLAKFTRRNRALVTGALIAVIALFVGLGGAVWQAQAARNAEEDARARLDEAVRQADYLLNTVSARLQVVLGTHDLQVALGEQVHELFEDLARQHPENRLVQQRLWESERLLAGLAAGRGDQVRRLGLLRTSHDRVRRAHEREPDDPELRFQLAYSLRSLSAAVPRTEDGGAESERLVRQAHDVLAELVAQHPDEPIYRREFVNTHTFCAGHARARGDFQAAETLLDDALVHAERTAALEGHEVRSGTLQAGARRALADLAVARGDEPGAERWYREMLAIHTALGERAPHDVRVQHGIVQARTSLAQLALDQGRAEEAVEHALAALDRQERLAEGDRDRPDRWNDVAGCCDLLAAAARAAGRPAEASMWADRAGAARRRADEGREQNGAGP